MDDDQELLELLSFVVQRAGPGRGHGRALLRLRELLGRLVRKHIIADAPATLDMSLEDALRYVGTKRSERERAEPESSHGRLSAAA